MSDDLVERAKRAAQERAEALADSGDWGYRLRLAEPGDSVLARWRGETTDVANGDRRVFLFWDEAGDRCYSRTYKSLEAEIDRVKPTLGCRIAIFRGDDYATGYANPGQSYGVEVEPCDLPLPEEDEQPPAAGSSDEGDGIPF